MTVLGLKDRVSEDLSLRNMASDIFKAKEFQDAKEILIDFTGIKFISRSFAHEYLQCKAKQQCQLFEVNVSSNIKKMFEIVESTKVKSELVRSTEPVEINIPQQ